MKTSKTRGVALGIALSLASAGCAMYAPVRWPSRELWVAAPAERPAIPSPSRRVADYPLYTEEQRVAVGLLLLDPDQSKKLFHVDLPRRGVQPLLLAIRNRGDHPYQFRKTDVDPPSIPADQAARKARIHPVVTAARYARWLTFLVPGIIFTSVVEPATQWPFEGIEDASRHPPRTDNAGISSDFAQAELTDAVIGPNRVHAGMLFVRPPALGSSFTITLTDTQTQQPLSLHIPTLPMMSRVYPQPFATVWDAAVEAAQKLEGWTLASKDEDRGAIALSTGERFFIWNGRTTITVSFKKITGRRTQVTTAFAVLKPRRLWCDARGTKIAKTTEQFAELLDSRLGSPRRARTHPRGSTRAATGEADTIWQSPIKTP